MIIGLCGPRHVGKTTFAAKMPGRVVSFAGPLRQILAAAGSPHGKGEPGYRGAMLEVGEALRTVFGIRCLLDAMDREIQAGEVDVVIDDVRTIDEAVWVVKRGGRIFELRRAGIEYTDEIYDRRLPEHLIHAIVELE